MRRDAIASAAKARDSPPTGGGEKAAGTREFGPRHPPRQYRGNEVLAGSHDPLLVTLSVVVAVLASFTALDMAARVNAAPSRRAALPWLLAGGIAMGTGIWSMHFVGMLAFSLPIPLAYDPWTTLQSLLAAVAAALFALWLVSLPTLPRLRLVLGGLLMGLGIAWMHYVGMAALHMQPAIDYEPVRFVLSVLVAVAAAWAALFIAFRLRATQRALPLRFAAATVMGLAIVGMHYTGMAAARFPAGAACGAAQRGGIAGGWLAAGVVLLTVAVMLVVLLVSLFEQRRQAHLLQLRNTTLAASLDEAQRELLHASRHDALTGLPNRQLAHEHITLLLQQCTREGRTCAVMVLDLDDFGHINRAFGPQAGDAVMADVAARLRQALPAGGVVGRLGGDRYVAAASLEHADAATALAQRLLGTLAAVQVAGRGLHVSGSLGMAVQPLPGDCATQRVSQAETALAHARQAGPNRHAHYAEWMDAGAAHDRHLLDDLRAAIGTPQLSLHYQPRVWADNGRGCCAEALLRWRHPEHGPLPSQRVVRLAERHGLMEALGQWVLDEACRQLRSWRDAGHRDWQVSVNLSAQQLASPALADTVRQCLEQNDLPAAQLLLEIDETSAVHAGADAPGTLHALAALGVGIAIDNFGGGNAGLLQLRRLPASRILLHPAFVQALEERDEDATLLAAVVTLGHALDMEVGAKGIENPRQRIHVEQLGCDQLQGHQIGRPASAEQFIRLYGSH